MTFSAALPGAALRVMRTAAGRRALQLALLVCGLFAVGLLYGEQAHATDEVTSTTSAEVVRQSEPGDGVLAATRVTVGRLLNPPAERADESAGDPIEGMASEADSSEADFSKSASPEANSSEANSSEVDPSEATAPQHPQDDNTLRHPRTPRPADRILRPVTEDVVAPVSERVVRPVTEKVVGSVDERVVRPVGDLVGGVTEGLAEAQRNIPPLSLLPSLPVTPESPVLPELPGALLPGLPELPLPPVLPVLPGHTLPAPVTSTPQPAPDAGADGKAAGDGASKQRTDGVAAVTYGPMFVADVTPAGDARHAAGHRVQPTEYAPDPQAPGGDPGGALGNRSTADNGASRHGDAHAVALYHRAPLRLVAGAAARHDAGETRDRHPDIPVSPA